MTDRSRINELLRVIDAEADPVSAEQLARYFQVRPGGYGEGDRFVGVRVSRIRQLVRPYVREPVAPAALSVGLRSPVHEHRLCCLVLLAEYAKQAHKAADDARLTAAYNAYVRDLDRVDNWDLVDCSAPDVVGGYLLDRDRAPLYDWIRSDSVWRRRIALVATHRLILAGQTADTYALATEVLDDRHDLIHKASGWMLREASKRVDETELRAYLDAHVARMPRTMLRYAIERFPREERRDYLTRPI
ncbi:MAG TPA: DNA alkylation repair protein [Nocardioidaceae bacterium]|nr:DNA alkylation repair protein [Nocardioidaceae bacterium]